jgi:hypothetical protein
MTKFAIRLHPCVPVSIDELEQWLDHQVMDLRAAAPEGTVRLSRLTQALPSGDVDIGWLLELELSERERLRALDRIAEALRDMRLLGFQPDMLAPIEVSEGAAIPQGHATVAVPSGSGANGEWW